MSRTNLKKSPPTLTHGGAITKQDSVSSALRRSVLACMLWENEFYEDGELIANRIQTLARQVPLEELSALAKEARHVMHLRHVPLLLTVIMAERGTKIVSDTILEVVSRADELAELVAIYWKLNGKKMRTTGDRTMATLPKQILLGLKKAFPKFSEYELAKYNRAREVKLRDVLFLAHPKPKDEEQAAVWKRLASNELVTPDTWEVALSASNDKKTSWTRLLKEGKLGYLALLRNLRNMNEVGVDEKLVRQAITARKGAHQVLPFRFIAAAHAAPAFTDVLDEAFLENLKETPKLPGKTVVIVDVSGSMYHSHVSAKSDMTRAHAASALAAIAREVCEIPRIYSTAGSDSKRIHKTELVPAFRGLALAKGVYDKCHPLGGGGIFLKQVMDYVGDFEKEIDRVIVITDEQDCGTRDGDKPGDAKILGKFNYIINVASPENGIAHEKWTKINGFSEAIVNYIRESESVSN